MKATEKKPLQSLGLEDPPNAVALLVCLVFALLEVFPAQVPRQDSLMSAREVHTLLTPPHPKLLCSLSLVPACQGLELQERPPSICYSGLEMAL